jgi:hypothetical protein
MMKNLILISKQYNNIAKVISYAQYNKIFAQDIGQQDVHGVK